MGDLRIDKFLWAFGINKLTDQSVAADQVVVITDVHTNHRITANESRFHLPTIRMTLIPSRSPDAIAPMRSSLSATSWLSRGTRPLGMPWIDNVRNAP